MTGPAFAIGLAMLAALCFAGAAALQHRAVSAGSNDGDTLSLRGLGAVTRRPGWLAGLALAVGGSTMHATALVLAPLSVVQPIGVLAVPIAVVLTFVRTRRRPAFVVLLGVALTLAGVAVFVLTTAGTAVSTPPPDRATFFAGLVVAGVVVVLAGVGLARSGWVRCVACATAGAVAFGLVSALVRAVSQSVTTGPSDLLVPAVLATIAGIAVGVVVGGWLVQQAFTSGPPEVVIACLTVVDPIVAVLLGVILLEEGAATSTGTLFLLLVAAVTATVGVIALARYHPDAADRSPTPNPEPTKPDAGGDSAPDGSDETAAPSRRRYALLQRSQNRR